jgi:hypothetical protein
MMKVLITIFEICDYGGIVAGVENLIKGFRIGGHTVDLVILRPNDQDPYIRKAEGPKNAWKSVTGGEAHTLNGWYGVLVMGYGTPERIRKWQDYADGYDMVIHEIPNPKPVDGWRGIFEISPPQIVVVHDAHFRDMYPHLIEVAHLITALTVTNHAGYRALEWFPAPRAFIGAAHIPARWDDLLPWRDRMHRSVCAHVWKAWKHMDTVVQASLSMKSHLILGGDGIEGRYMRSKDKCKPKYQGLWQQFMNTKHEYVGLLAHENLLRLYANSRLMIDMSYSKKFAALGNHFNRSILESANYGCISLCTTENMAPTNEQVVLWEDGKTHIAVPHDITPESLAEVVDWAVSLPESEVRDMIGRVRQILSDHFDYRKAPAEFIKLAAGKPAGIYPRLDVGAWPGTP